MDAAELLKKVTDEIVEVHDFISGWFRGEIEQNEAKLQQEFMNRFVASFVNLQPAGNKLDYDKLQTMMTSNWGVNPEFHIKIHDVEVVWCSENDENVLQRTSRRKRARAIQRLQLTADFQLYFSVSIRSVGPIVGIICKKQHCARSIT